MTDTNTNGLKGEGTLTLGKKKYTYVLNNNALRIMCRTLNASITDVSKLMQSNPLEAVPQFIYAGITNHYARKAQKFDMEYDTFCALFGDVWDNETEMDMINAVISNAWSIEEADESEQKEAVETAGQ